MESRTYRRTDTVGCAVKIKYRKEKTTMSYIYIYVCHAKVDLQSASVLVLQVSMSQSAPSWPASKSMRLKRFPQFVLDEEKYYNRNIS